MVVISSLIPAATQIPVWQENYARSEAGDLLLVHESKPHLIGRREVPRNLKVDGKSLSFLWSKKTFSPSPGGKNQARKPKKNTKKRKTQKQGLNKHGSAKTERPVGWRHRGRKEDFCIDARGHQRPL